MTDEDVKQEQGDPEESSASNLSPGDSSTEDVKPDSPSGKVKAVPYHRLQKEVWKRQEAERKLNELLAQQEEERKSRSGQQAQAFSDADLPDSDTDPVGYSIEMAKRARTEAQSAREMYENLQAERNREKLVSGLHREFSTALEQYPLLQKEDFREFAFEQLCLAKEQTKGHATADQVLATLDSMFRSYGQETDQVAKNDERAKLRGKPKGGLETRSERKVRAGEPPSEPGETYRERMNRTLNSVREKVTERLKNQDKRLAGL